MMKLVRAVLASAMVLIVGASAASAAVVCNRDGDCWRVSGKPRYEPGLKLRIMPDNWKWGAREHYRWREPGHGHGYYRSGVWVTIR